MGCFGTQSITGRILAYSAWISKKHEYPRPFSSVIGVHTLKVGLEL
jgi:hypothetical protein